MNESLDRYISVNNFSIRYRELGNGMPLILVHGIAGFLEEWESAMNLLCKKYRVIALDLPGHGLSDKPDISYTLDFLAVFLKDFIQAVSEEKIYLAGHSLGGAICLNFAIKYPHLVDRLIIVNSAFVKIPLKIRLGSFVFLPKLTKLIRKIPMFIVKSFSRNSFFNKELIGDQWLRDSFRYINQPGSLRVMFSIISSNITLLSLKKEIVQYFMEGLGKINIPVLIICGEKDRILPVENSLILHKHIKNSRYICFRNCGHELQCECCNQFCEEVFKFLH